MKIIKDSPYSLWNSIKCTIRIIESPERGKREKGADSF